MALLAGPEVPVELADKEAEEEEEYGDDDGDDGQTGEEGVSQQEVAGLVEAAQQTEAGEGGVVEEPGQEELGLLGDEAHQQHQGAHQPQQADHQEAAQTYDAQLAWLGGEDEDQDS